MMGRILLNKCPKCRGALFEEIDNTGDATCSSCGTTFPSVFSSIPIRDSKIAIEVKIDIERELKTYKMHPLVRKAIMLKERNIPTRMIGSMMGYSEVTIRRWVSGAEGHELEVENA